MRWRLSRKILLIALLNLALVAAVITGFLLSQFGFGAEALLAGPARDRIQAIGNAFSLALDHPETETASLFETYRARYGADFFLVDPDGRTLAGPPLLAPRELMQRMHPGPM